MIDVLMLLILVAFFALTVFFVKACERIIGPDIETARVDATPPVGSDEQAAA